MGPTPPLISLISYPQHTHLIPSPHSARRKRLSSGRRSTQSLLEELLRAWPPLGRGWLSCGRRSTQSLLEEQAQHTEPSEELLRAWPPLGRRFGFRAAGAVHRAFWRSCCARGRRWAAAGCAAAGFRVAGVGRRWQAQYTKPSGQSAARVAAAAASRDRRRRENLCLMSALCVNVVRGLVARLVPS